MHLMYKKDFNQLLLLIVYQYEQKKTWNTKEETQENLYFQKHVNLPFDSNTFFFLVVANILFS